MQEEIITPPKKRNKSRGINTYSIDKTFLRALANESVVSPSKRAKTVAINRAQSLLQEEKKSHKPLALMQRDIELTFQFYKIVSKLLKTLQEQNKQQIKLMLETEDKVITKINQSNAVQFSQKSCFLPKIFMENNDLYRRLFIILQSHPCYLKFLFIRGALTVDEIIDLIFGGDYYFLNTPRDSYILCGLFITFSNIFEYNQVIEGTELESLYYRIFECNHKNTDYSYKILAFEFLILFEASLELYLETSIEKDKDDPIKIYENLDLFNIIINEYKGQDEKYDELFVNKYTKHLKKQKDYLMKFLLDGCDYTKELSFSMEVPVIAKEVYSKCVKYNRKEFLKECFYTIFTTRLENTLITLRHSDHENIDYNIMTRYLRLEKDINAILSNKKNSQVFPNLYNLFRSNRQLFNDRVHKKLLFYNYINSKDMKKSWEFMKFFISIYQNIFNERHYESAMITEINKPCVDFTLRHVIQEFTDMSELQDHKHTISISYKNLMKVQLACYRIKKDLFPTDPLRNLMEEFEGLKIEEFYDKRLENQYINLDFNPYSILLNYRIEDFESHCNREELMLCRCRYCYLALPHVFIPPQRQEECIFGPSWECLNCAEEEISESIDNSNLKYNIRKYRKAKGTINKGYEIYCKNCKSIKNYSQINSEDLFFSRYFVKYDEEIVSLFEKTLLILPQLDEGEDINTAISNNIFRLKDKKDDESKYKVKVITKFRDRFNEYRNSKSYATDDVILGELQRKIIENIQERRLHFLNIEKIDEVIRDLEKLNENSKKSTQLLEKKLKIININLDRGYCDSLFKGAIPKKEDEKNNNKEPNIKASKKYSIKELKKWKYILSDKINGNKIDDLSSDSDIQIIKEKNSYKIMINLRASEGIDELIHPIPEKIIREIREKAKYHYPVEIESVNYNSFGLQKLINSILN